MRIPIKIGKELSTDIATSWQDLTVKEFHQLMVWAEKGQDDAVELYSILLNISPKIIERVHFGSLKAVVESRLTWLKTKHTFSEVKPITIQIGSKFCMIPESLDMISFGQYLGLDQYLSKLQRSEGNDLERMRVVVTTVLWKELYPKLDFTIERLKARMRDVDLCNYSECYALELFFWKSYWNSKKKEKGGFRVMLTKIAIRRDRILSRRLAN